MIVRRLAGLAFFVTVIAFIGFTTLVYTKAFRSVVMVDLVSDSVGNALPADADVKIRGVIVGEVRSATPENGRVVSRIALDEASAPMIPANVTARLLPKTLFGERYVALQIPDGARDRPIAEGDVIEQDVSGNAIEVGQLLDSVLPLLDAVPPDKLASTLGALAQALDGRGEMLGTTIDRLETVFAGLNSELPTLRTDLVEFATLTETYSTAAPDLIDALDNLSVTGSTLVEKRPAVDTLLTSAIATSGSTADLLDANRDSIITLASGSRETLELLAEFSPTLGCTLTSFAALLPEANRILGAGDAYPGARGTIRFVNPRGAYLPNQDEPRLIDDRGAACYDDVTAPGTFFPQYPGSGLNDGSYQVPSRNPGPANVRFEADPLQSPVPADATLGLPAGSYAGSDIERTTLAVVYGQGSGIDPGTVPAWTTLVGAPALRGSEVTVN